jgi:hypothetical protein
MSSGRRRGLLVLLSLATAGWLALLVVGVATRDVPVLQTVTTAAVLVATWVAWAADVRRARRNR